MSAGIDKVQLEKDVQRITKTLQQVSRVLKKDTQKLIMQTMVFALQSAAKATDPGRGTNLSRLPKKFRVRPLVKIPENEGFYYKDKSGQIFKTDQKIPPAKARRRGLTVMKGIKTWDKERNQWTYVPYAGTKRDESDKRFKIVFAGAAKGGWLKAYKDLGKKNVNLGETRKSKKKYTRVIKRTDLIEVTNLVLYISKISPQSANIGLTKAGNRLEKVWMPKIEKQLEKNWEKRPNTYLLTIGKLA